MTSEDSKSEVLKGKVAVVTGGGRGIGAATARALATAGVHVAVLARTVEQIDAVAGEVRAQGGVGEAVRCDVADPFSVKTAMATVERQLGSVDILINNAGVVWPLGPSATIDFAAWTEALAINLTGAFACIQAVLPGMLARRWGRIVNVSTGAAAGSGMVPANAYSVSKAGLEMLTLNLAAELKGSGVLAHAFRPGTVESEMQIYVRSQSPAEVGEALVTQFQAMKDQGQLLAPHEPADLLVRLLSEETTGEVISIYDERGQALLRAYRPTSAAEVKVQGEER
jgi:NAD(P)-dependent dehydrogenase (short-subunit alcohol dehydrogenase family)